MALYVLDGGCAFEQAVMGQGRGNALFDFLFDLRLMEHTYYVWRLYSFAQDWRRLEKEKSDELNSSSSCCLNFDVYPANSDLNSIFSHGDMVDTLLMIRGFIGVVGDGFAIPAFFMFARVIFNDMGQGSIEAVNENVIYLVYLADGSFLASFMEGYCWSRTGEQQASRMRVRYLTAVLRQDVEYFDLNTGTSSEVITSITSDNLVIQDCLSEKVPNFIMNCATFVGCYAR
ncbi:hypothetical protein ZIOFF_068636 [Zingiber officinale]|uniref:ABC transmembrane type-1 domain-containing protein n=1 Tax=Zingiber officinale TaxID=94328 RepID=A0A8J5CYC9_ZINOF|nr:hypothetical protein ZIOFF_068636 [Zingiber officinale]